MAHLALSFLGSFAATLDGEPIQRFEYDKVRALLAYLAVESSRAHRRETLTGLLWPERPESTARQSLSQALFRLRRVIGEEEAEPPFLLVTLEAIRFNPASDYWVDVAAFSRVAETYLQPRAPAVLDPTHIEQLEAGLDLYRGPFLDGFLIPDSAAFEEWCVLHRERLHRQAMELLSHLAAACKGHGQHGRALGHAWRQLELDPWREESHRQVMALLAHCGRRSEALAQYETCRRVLAEELGVEPGAQIRRLYEQIRDDLLDVCTDLLPIASREAPAPVAVLSLGEVAQRPRNLPLDPTPFIGRERELAQIAERLADPACRLLTVVGPGGVGKTRLAIQAVRGQAARFRDGVCFVDLTAVGSADLLGDAILRALHVPSAGAIDADRRLLDYVNDKQMLLAFDNFEHLLAAQSSTTGSGRLNREDGSGLLVQILSQAPGVKLLVTSRERLNLREEWLEPLEGMDVPPAAVAAADGEDRPAEQAITDAVSRPWLDLAAYDASRLFLGCVERLHPDYRPDRADIFHIVHICRLLEGMPLGIELAASWAGRLPLAGIAAELARGLDVLTTTFRDVPERHRSMRAAFDHSWQRLSARKRSILRRLSVFRGGFTHGAAEVVAGASVADLSGLADRSWLRAEPSGRYTLHELIRQYCGEKLEADHLAEASEAGEQVRDRHCTYYATFLKGYDKHLHRLPQALTEIAVEAGNLEAAWQWAIEHEDYGLGDKMVAGLHLMTEMVGWHSATMQLFDTAIPKLRERLAAGAGVLHRQEAGLLLANILIAQVFMCHDLGWLQRAGACVEEGLAVLSDLESGDKREEYLAMTRYQLAWTRLLRGDFGGAASLFHELQSYWQVTDIPFWPYIPEVGAGVWRSHAYRALGRIHWYQGRYEKAKRLLLESLKVYERIGEQRVRAGALRSLARVLLTTGEYRESERSAQEGLRLSRAYGGRTDAGWVAETSGAVAAATGSHAEARVCFAESLAIARETGHHQMLADSLNGLAGLALASGDLDEAQQLFEEGRAAFERLGIEGTLGYAPTLIGLGDVAAATGRLADAKEWFRCALSARACTAWQKMDAIAGMAQVSARAGDVVGAAELLAFIADHAFTSHQTRERVRGLLRELELELPTEVFAAALERGQHLQIDEVVAELVGG